MIVVHNIVSCWGTNSPQSQMFGGYMCRVHSTHAHAYNGNVMAIIYRVNIDGSQWDKQISSLIKYINCQGKIYTAIYNKWIGISGIIRYQLISDTRGNTGRNNNIPELSN